MQQDLPLNPRAESPRADVYIEDIDQQENPSYIPLELTMQRETTIEDV